MCGAVCEMLQGMEGGWVVIEASHTVSYWLNATSRVGPVCEISQSMEGGWVVIEASHMMGYELNVTFNMLIIVYRYEERWPSDKANHTCENML